ncbi:MAG: hypothetical protein ACREPG_13250 [Candidatus Binatia bacterium]
MDTASMPRFEAMTTGALLDRAVRLYANNFALLLGITAVAYVPFYLVMLVFQSSISFNPHDESAPWAAILYFIVFMVLWTSIAFPIAGGAATYAISERYLGNHVAINAALRRGLTNFWSVSMAQITVSIRVVIGLLLLIVPGVLWLLSYSLVVPTILVEGQKAMPSLRRSRELMRGQRGKAFAIMIVLILLEAISGAGISSVSKVIIGTDSTSGLVLHAAITSLMSIFLAPLGIVATILLYYDMRIRKEGFDLDMLSRAITDHNGQSVTAAPTLSV